MLKNKSILQKTLFEDFLIYDIRKENNKDPY